MLRGPGRAADIRDGTAEAGTGAGTRLGGAGWSGRRPRLPQRPSAALLARLTLGG